MFFEFKLHALMARGSCHEPRVKDLGPAGLPVEILSDRPLWVICQSGRSLSLAHRVVLEIAMAMIGNAGSATAILIAFSTESILRRI